MSEVNTVLDMIKNLQVSAKTFVEFDPDSGELIRVGKKGDDDNSYVEVNPNDITHIMSGEKTMSEYKVIFDIGLKEYVLREKGDLETENDHVYNTLFEIPSDVAEDCDVTIIQDNIDKCWKIKVSDSLREFLKSEAVSINSNIFFSITAKFDPNILFRVLRLSVNDLINADEYTFPFEYKFENINDKVSIYTAKYFDTYKHEVLG
jgi:hypothetical protein